MPTLRLDEKSIETLKNFPWKGNVRQLKNITEQISVIEQNRNLTNEILESYLPKITHNLPALIKDNVSSSDFANEREILYKDLFDMRNDINDLKKLTQDLIKGGDQRQATENTQLLINKIYEEQNNIDKNELEIIAPNQGESYKSQPQTEDYDDAETIEDTISLQEKEYEMIKKSLERNKGKRKLAAKELGISERTLYRKIKQYDL